MAKLNSDALRDLYETLKRVLEHLPDKELEGTWDFENARLIRQALAKAETVNTGG